MFPLFATISVVHTSGKFPVTVIDIIGNFTFVSLVSLWCRCGTGGKFTAGVVDTSDKLANGVVDTSGAP